MDEKVEMRQFAETFADDFDDSIWKSISSDSALDKSTDFVDPAFTSNDIANILCTSGVSSPQYDVDSLHFDIFSVYHNLVSIVSMKCIREMSRQLLRASNLTCLGLEVVIKLIRLHIKSNDVEECCPKSQRKLLLWHILTQLKSCSHLKYEFTVKAKSKHNFWLSNDTFTVLNKDISKEVKSLMDISVCDDDDDEQQQRFTLHSEIIDQVVDSHVFALSHELPMPDPVLTAQVLNDPQTARDSFKILVSNYVDHLINTIRDSKRPLTLDTIIINVYHEIYDNCLEYALEVYHAIVFTLKSDCRVRWDPNSVSLEFYFVLLHDDLVDKKITRKISRYSNSCESISRDQFLLDICEVWQQSDNESDSDGDSYSNEKCVICHSNEGDSTSDIVCPLDNLSLIEGDYRSNSNNIDSYLQNIGPSKIDESVSEFHAGDENKRAFLDAVFNWMSCIEMPTSQQFMAVSEIRKAVKNITEVADSTEAVQYLMSDNRFIYHETEERFSIKVDVQKPVVAVLSATIQDDCSDSDGSVYCETTTHIARSSEIEWRDDIVAWLSLPQNAALVFKWGVISSAMGKYYSITSKLGKSLLKADSRIQVVGKGFGILGCLRKGKFTSDLCTNAELLWLDNVFEWMQRTCPIESILINTIKRSVQSRDVTRGHTVLLRLDSRFIVKDKRVALIRSGKCKVIGLPCDKNAIALWLDQAHELLSDPSHSLGLSAFLLRKAIMQPLPLVVDPKEILLNDGRFVRLKGGRFVVKESQISPWFAEEVAHWKTMIMKYCKNSGKPFNCGTIVYTYKNGRREVIASHTVKQCIQQILSILRADHTLEFTQVGDSQVVRVVSDLPVTTTDTRVGNKTTQKFGGGGVTGETLDTELTSASSISKACVETVTLSQRQKQWLDNVYSLMQNEPNKSLPCGQLEHEWLDCLALDERFLVDGDLVRLQGGGANFNKALASFCSAVDSEKLWAIEEFKFFVVVVKKYVESHSKPFDWGRVASMYKTNGRTLPVGIDTRRCVAALKFLFEHDRKFIFSYDSAMTLNLSCRELTEGVVTRLEPQSPSDVGCAPFLCESESNDEDNTVHAKASVSTAPVSENWEDFECELLVPVSESVHAEVATTSLVKCNELAVTKSGQLVVAESIQIEEEPDKLSIVERDEANEQQSNPSVFSKVSRIEPSGIRNVQSTNYSASKTTMSIVEKLKIKMAKQNKSEKDEHSAVDAYVEHSVVSTDMPESTSENIDGCENVAVDWENTRSVDTVSVESQEKQSIDVFSTQSTKNNAESDLVFMSLFIADSIVRQLQCHPGAPFEVFQIYSMLQSTARHIIPESLKTVPTSKLLVMVVELLYTDPRLQYSNTYQSNCEVFWLAGHETAHYESNGRLEMTTHNTGVVVEQIRNYSDSDENTRLERTNAPVNSEFEGVVSEPALKKFEYTITHSVHDTFAVSDSEVGLHVKLSNIFVNHAITKLISNASRKYTFSDVKSVILNNTSTKVAPQTFSNERLRTLSTYVLKCMFGDVRIRCCSATELISLSGTSDQYNAVNETKTIRSAYNDHQVPDVPSYHFHRTLDELSVVKDIQIPVVDSVYYYTVSYSVANLWHPHEKQYDLSYLQLLARHFADWVITRIITKRCSFCLLSDIMSTIMNNKQSQLLPRHFSKDQLHSAYVHVVELVVTDTRLEYDDKYFTYTEGFRLRYAHKYYRANTSHGEKLQQSVDKSTSIVTPPLVNYSKYIESKSNEFVSMALLKFQSNPLSSFPDFSVRVTDIPIEFQRISASTIECGIVNRMKKDNRLRYWQVDDGYGYFVLASDTSLTTSVAAVQTGAVVSIADKVYDSFLKRQIPLFKHIAESTATTSIPYHVNHIVGTLQTKENKKVLARCKHTVDQAVDDIVKALKKNTRLRYEGAYQGCKEVFWLQSDGKMVKQKVVTMKAASVVQSKCVEMVNNNKQGQDMGSNSGGGHKFTMMSDW